MRRLGSRLLDCGGSALLLLSLAASALAQNAAIDDIKGKIFDAHMAEKIFADGVNHCDKLDGTRFYYQIRNRVLDLQAYRHALDDLARAQAYNPQTRRPWSVADANRRWDEVKKQAQLDKQRCDLIRSLPGLEKQLRDLEEKAAAAGKKG